MTTPRHRRLAPSRRTRLAVVVAVSAIVIAVALAVVTTRPSEATDAKNVPFDSVSINSALTDLQAAQRGIDRADRGTERTAVPSTATDASAVAGVDTKPAPSTAAATAKPAAATAKPSSKPAAATTSAKKSMPPPAVVGHQFATAALKIRATASPSATVRKVIPRGTRIGVTGIISTTWTQIVIDAKTAWVTKAYLSTSRPKPAKATSGSAPTATKPSGGLSTAACASGSSMESGLSANAVRVHRAACASFPSVRRFGGIGPTGEHAAGRAVDIMVSGDSLGDAISTWARKNAGSLHISEVIWSRHIWTVQRSSEGWRSMSDRGSATANHYDHVHVTVY